MNNKEKILIFAHRGASNLTPENTLKAFKKAIELNADYIEFDVHRSKDGEIVIIHDANTFRTTGHFGLIKNMTLEELKELDCGDGERIPTLRELIKLAKNKIGLNCEVKARGLAEQIVNIINEEEMIESTIISSFKHDVLMRIQKLDPRIKLASLEPSRTGWIKSWLSRKKLIKVAINNKLYAINPFFRLVNENFIDKAHNNNLKIFPWTVNSDSAIKKLINNGVDGIITNDVERVRELLNRKK
ncbi:MAG: glycerophosphodiester phosphodiesterase [Candidatus Lokiarchaeota archaeon]|nr:glycerophosphodiester phosphodiesterase [Candidatus Lokiarchaeota archaeon]